MAKNQKVQFKRLPNLRERQGFEDLTIVGGMIREKDVLKWLAKWSLNEMPWQLWETTDELQLKQDSALPTLTDVELMMLERVRFFGEGGDLTLRRDDEQFRWYFIGPKGVTVPDGSLSKEDFWDDNPKKKLTRFKGQVILWGVWDSVPSGYDKSDDKLWVENRVGFANLAYPEELHGQRHVYAHYWEFLDAGQVAFVWMYQLGAGEDDPLLSKESDKRFETVRKQPRQPLAQSLLGEQPEEPEIKETLPEGLQSGQISELLPDEQPEEPEVEEVRPDEQPEEPQIPTPGKLRREGHAVEEVLPDELPQEAETQEVSKPKSRQDDTSQVSQKDDSAPKPRTLTEIIKGLFGFGRG